jgi:hypothetical protein
MGSEYERFVIISYYFWLMDRTDTAEQLYGERGDYTSRTSYYLRRISELHRDGMKSLRTVVATSGGAHGDYQTS